MNKMFGSSDDLQSCTRLHVANCAKETSERHRVSGTLVRGATIRTFVKSLVKLSMTVAASDFHDDFLFHHFLSNHLLLRLKRRRRLHRRPVPGTA